MREGNAGAVVLLLEAGARVDERTGTGVRATYWDSGMIALHISCQAGVTSVVNVLLANGATTSGQGVCFP